MSEVLRGREWCAHSIDLADDCDICIVAVDKDNCENCGWEF